MEISDVSGAIIFAVDDNPKIMQVMIEYLRPLGITIVPFRSGEEMLKLVRERPPDLILLDVNLPGRFNGFETCVRLKQDKETWEIPVIFFSTATNEIDRVTCFNAGGADYISMSVEEQELRSRVVVHVAINMLRNSLAVTKKNLTDRTEQLAAANENLQQEIIERRRIEEELMLAKATAEMGNNTRSNFLARMNHEISTPMNAIIEKSHLILNTDLTVRQRNYANRIMSTAYGILEKINDFLDMSAIEEKDMTLEPAEFLLEDVLKTLATMFSISLGEKNLELLLDIHPDVPQNLIGDALRLGQVLIHLTSNAIKFSKDGEIRLSIEVKNLVLNEVTLSFAVRDSGIGMTQEQIGAVLYAFRQVDPSTTTRFGGIGPGLAVCKRLVTKMGGEIGVTSETGNGSVFEFTAEFGMSGKFRDEVPFKPPPILQDMKVLVVDDSKDSREVQNAILASLLFNVTLAESGPRALEILETTPPDESYTLVLIDWWMPGLDGVETVARMKASTILKRMPYVIMATAYGHEDVLKKAKDVGIDATMLKPVTRSSLLNTIMSLLGADGSDTRIDQTNPARRELDN